MKKTFFLFFYSAITLITIGCSNDDMDTQMMEDEIMIDELSTNQLLAIDYFTEIALGFEFGSETQVTRKWNSDVVIFVAGTPTELLLDELETVVNELNGLIVNSGIQLRFTTIQSEANFDLFIGTGDAYAQFFPTAAPFIDENLGLFFINFDGQNFFTSASMYVDTERPTELKQRHLLREELTQALGLARDSDRFLDSIFQISFELGCTLTYSQFDEVLIQLLYDPRVGTGLDENTVRPILEEIINDFI